MGRQYRATKRQPDIYWRWRSVYYPVHLVYVYGGANINRYGGMITYQIIYGLSNIPFAALNARWIEKGRRILHAWNGALHLAAAICGWIFWGWEVFFIILLNTRIIFDTWLSIFRGLDWDYVSPDPKSIVDKIEKKVFGSNVVYARIAYAVASIILNAVYYDAL